MSWRSWFTENPPSLRPKLSRQPQMPVQPHANASAAAAASFMSASVYQSRSCAVRGARRTLNREQGKVGQDFLDKSPMQSDELKMEIAYGEGRGLTPQSETQV